MRDRATTIVAVFAAAFFAPYSATALPLAPVSQTSQVQVSQTSQVQYAAQECPRDRCLRPYPSYYDTPPELRPRTFYGYSPHRQGDWYRYYKTWFGYDFFGYRGKR